MWEAGALRGAPASMTRTRRRARDSTRAADSPAAPPPMTTTSYRVIRPDWSGRRSGPTSVAVSGKREWDEPMDPTPPADGHVLAGAGEDARRRMIRRIV